MQWRWSHSWALTLWEAEAGQDTTSGRGRDAVPASHEERHTGTPSSVMAFSSSLLHNATFRHTRDTEGCPVYSIHISCGLAQKLVKKKPLFSIIAAQFSPAEPIALLSHTLRADFS